MKGRKHAHDRKGRSTGGVNDAPEDLASKPMRYTADSKVIPEAEEKKRGGRAKKHVGDVSGEAAKMRADRKPRKNGGRTGSDTSPFSSARRGSPPAGHKVEMENC